MARPCHDACAVVDARAVAGACAVVDDARLPARAPLSMRAQRRLVLVDGVPACGMRSDAAVPVLLPTSAFDPLLSVSLDRGPTGPRRVPPSVARPLAVSWVSLPPGGCPAGRS